MLANGPSHSHRFKGFQTPMCDEGARYLWNLAKVIPGQYVRVRTDDNITLTIKAVVKKFSFRLRSRVWPSLLFPNPSIRLRQDDLRPRKPFERFPMQHIPCPLA